MHVSLLLHHHPNHFYVWNSSKKKEINKDTNDHRKKNPTEADRSAVVNAGGLEIVGCSPDNLGDIDRLFWSWWFELVFNGENGDVIALGLLAGKGKFRDDDVDVWAPLTWELFTTRVDGDGTKRWKITIEIM